jgi:hypothetical protein
MRISFRVIERAGSLAGSADGAAPAKMTSKTFARAVETLAASFETSARCFQTCDPLFRKHGAKFRNIGAMFRKQRAMFRNVGRMFRFNACDESKLSGEVSKLEPEVSIHSG